MNMKKKGEWIRQAYRVLQAFPFVQGALYYVEVCPSGQQSGGGVTRFIHALDLRSVNRGAGPDALLKRNRFSFFPIQGLFVEKGILYQVFGKLDGNLMADHLYRSVPLSLAETIHILKVVSGHLVRMYERREFTVIHPQNMILSQDSVRFLYGGPIGMLPKRGGGNQPPTPAGEQQREEPLDAYSFGALAYIMLTGASPVPGSVTPIQSYRRDVPPELEHFVIKSLTADPKSRPRVSDIWGWLDALPLNTDFEKKKSDPIYWLKPDKESLETYLFQFPDSSSQEATDPMDATGWEGWEAGEVDAGPWIKRTTVAPTPSVRVEETSDTSLSKVEPAPLPEQSTKKPLPQPKGEQVWTSKDGTERLKEQPESDRSSKPTPLHPVKAWLSRRPVIAIATVVALLGGGIGAYFLNAGGLSADEAEEAARYYGESVKSFKDHHLDEAITQAQKAVKADPKEEEYLIYLANLYNEKKQHDRSINVLKKGVKTAPKARVYDSLSVYLLMDGEKDEARDAVEKALKLDPDNPRFLYHRGKVYGARENYDAAAQALQKAVKLEPDSARYHGMLSYYLLHTGDIEGAKEHGEKATQLEPRGAFYWMKVGQAYLADRQKVYHDGGDSKKNRGEMAKRTEVAIHAFHQVVSLDPKSGQGYYYLSIAQYFYGSFSASEKSAQNSVRLSPKIAGYQYQYGVVLQKQGKKKEAKNAYEQALKLDAGNARYEKALGEFQKQEKKKKK
ncbi:tetratricopeptide repeat protein [Marininema halotolerans]|uniref:Tetratricopeptide repeat-containing protein n=1 Tax=Marininema halotolerans TaxID=1155944 RepID=A0A1I6T9G8_9BACL|nr:tetratricopeptide repeat protein [Marininema halotolerans]SFS85748.1 Tetratricopeptide repeat-containing protein [Marininema halotolerans]